ncbi:MAG: SAM-dependent methyltransferase [Flavobacteriales bacterium]|nr:SAM-dependent methyltransferase [Flavobacteriales bacterium]MCB9168301.1 SAM-dependent methyltransferase [Flavobacteriales bacterium]
MAPNVVETIRHIRHFFVEHERTARRTLRRMDPEFDLDRVHLYRLDKDSTEEDLDALLRIALEHGNTAILSEAGMPAIADPGARLVARAHVAGVRVVPLAGPSSFPLALAASGLNGQQFCFHGYLPRDRHERRQALQRIEREMKRTGATQMFMETPYRNRALLDELLRALSPGTLLCVALDLTQPGEQIVTRTVAEWRSSQVELPEAPALFLIGRT